MSRFLQFYKMIGLKLKMRIKMFKTVSGINNTYKTIPLIQCQKCRNKISKKINIVLVSFLDNCLHFMYSFLKLHFLTKTTWNVEQNIVRGRRINLRFNPNYVNIFCIYKRTHSPRSCQQLLVTKSFLSVT